MDVNDDGSGCLTGDGGSGCILNCQKQKARGAESECYTEVDDEKNVTLNSQQDIVMCPNSQQNPTVCPNSQHDTSLCPNSQRETAGRSCIPHSAENIESCDFRSSTDMEVDLDSKEMYPCVPRDIRDNHTHLCDSIMNLRTTCSPRCKSTGILSQGQDLKVRLPTSGQVMGTQTNHFGYDYELTRKLSSRANDYDNNSSCRQAEFRFDEDHPPRTISSSNSQLCFQPESSSIDLISDNQLKVFLGQPENNNPQVTDSCFMVRPHLRCTTNCCSFTREQCGYPPNISEGVDNVWATSAELDPDNHSLSQYQDAMQDVYRYHVFFSHCPQDRGWVEHLIAHLEAEPFNYTCAYTSLQKQADPWTQQERILCAAMLSERVVMVVSSCYVDQTWPSFEKTLNQLTKMSLHNQRIMAVVLEDCQIPESLAELYFLDSTDPDFFRVFTKRIQTSRMPRWNASVSSCVGPSVMSSSTSVTNGTILTFCPLHVKIGWKSFLVPADLTDVDVPPTLTQHGIGMERPEFVEIVTKVCGVIEASNKLPWLLSAQPLAALLLAFILWLPAFIAILVIHVDDDTGIALPGRLTVFLFPLGLVAGGYFIKWRRAYWLTKVARLLVQNCVDVNQALYFQGRPLFLTACHKQANVFAIYFVYFDATQCVRSVDLLLFTSMEDDWQKLLQLLTFYTRNENYLSRMSLPERLTVMMSAPYLVKFVKQVLPHPPQQRHVSRVLCLCQFTEECITRFAHGLDRDDVPGLAELFTRHMPGKVSGSAVRRIQEELFHASHGLVP